MCFWNHIFHLHNTSFPRANFQSWLSIFQKKGGVSEEPIKHHLCVYREYPLGISCLPHREDSWLRTMQHFVISSCPHISPFVVPAPIEAILWWWRHPLIFSRNSSSTHRLNEVDDLCYIRLLCACFLETSYLCDLTETCVKYFKLFIKRIVPFAALSEYGFSQGAYSIFLAWFSFGPQ